MSPWRGLFLALGTFFPIEKKMIAEKYITNPSKIVKHTYILFGVIMVLWIIAWIFKIQIDKDVGETELGMHKTDHAAQ
jgi:hypothetical protein